MTDGQSTGWGPEESGPYPVAPRIPPPRPEHLPAPGPDGTTDPPHTVDGSAYGDPSAYGAPASEGEADWWQSSDTRPDWVDQGPHQGPDQDVRETAWEIGVTIGEAVAAVLPTPPPTAAEQGWRGLDLTWLGLKHNIPAIGIALLVTWRGQNSVAGMTDYIAQNGVLAPLGVVLFVALLGGALMLLPIGNLFAAMFVQILRGLGHLTVRAWRARYIGYVLRLLVAVAAWSFLIAVLRLAGSAVLNWLTGA